jgi:hypothetical protein
MIGDSFVAQGDNPGASINISTTGPSQFIIGLAMKTISVLSTTKKQQDPTCLNNIRYYFVLLYFPA